MTSNNNTITITRAEKYALEAKAKRGWKTYFGLRNDYFILSNYLNDEKEANAKLVRDIKAGIDVDFSFLKSQFLDLYEKVGTLTDCPVCYETLIKDNSELPNCGHMICKTCKDSICKQGSKQCPICNVKYYEKK
jgi:hypothetical protein